jgi:hypothetical protein
MSKINKDLANKKQGGKKSQRFGKIAPLSDPWLVFMPGITESLKAALLKQRASVGVLLGAEPNIETRVAISGLLDGIEALFELLPRIEAAVQFAMDSGWQHGASQGVSEQNSKNVTKGHEKSKLAKQIFVAHWRKGEWKTKAACVRENYEQVLRESGLWKANVIEQKPEIETFIRYLRTIKK